MASHPECSRTQRIDPYVYKDIKKVLQKINRQKYEDTRILHSKDAVLCSDGVAFELPLKLPSVYSVEDLFPPTFWVPQTGV